VSLCQISLIGEAVPEITMSTLVMYVPGADVPRNVLSTTVHHVVTCPITSGHTHVRSHALTGGD